MCALLAITHQMHGGKCVLCVPLGWVMDGWATALTGRLGCALVASGTVWARPRGSCWGNSPWRGQCWRVRHLVSLASLVALLARLHPTMVPVDAATLDAVMAAAVGAGAPGFDARSLACAAGCCRAWRRHARPGAVAAAGLQGPRDKRAAACRALGALGEEAQPHVDALIKTLEETHQDHTSAAVEALASLHQAPRDEFDWQAGPLYAQCSEVLQQLGKLLYHSERTVSAAAAHVMFSLGEQVIEQHFYRLWELALEDGYSRGRFQVALETNGEYLKQEHVDCIIARLNVDDAESLLVCCTVLENAPGEFIAKHTDVVVRLLETEQPNYVSEMVCNVLGAVGDCEEARRHMDRIAKLIDIDDEYTLSTSACRCLGLMGATKYKERIASKLLEVTDLEEVSTEAEDLRGEACEGMSPYLSIRARPCMICLASPDQLHDIQRLADCAHLNTVSLSQGA